MEPDRKIKKKVAIIGAGPAGCACAYFLGEDFDVTLFDKSQPLKTLLPTGGGRCNLAHAEFDFKKLAENFPRGEKFLYSVFSRFSTADTIEFFEDLGVKTYTQDDGRIFPTSNSSKSVRSAVLKALGHCKFVKKEVTVFDNDFDFAVISTGSRGGFELAKSLGHKIVEQKPSLVGLVTQEDFSSIVGVSVNEILFTHKGVTGPKVYKISSLNARKSFPYSLEFDFAPSEDFQTFLNNNSQKTLKNALSMLYPKSFARYISGEFKETKCHEINAGIRDEIFTKLKHFKITVKSTVKDGETVNSGGVSLEEVNSKTMRSKLSNRVYFCGEVLDIDGFCGGFNLQNCWSTGFVAAEGIKQAAQSF